MHPYVAALGGAALVVVLGAYIVTSRASVGTQMSPPQTWSGAGADFSDPIGAAPQQTASNEDSLYTQVRSGAPFQYIAPPVQTDTPEGSDDFDLEGLLASISRPKGGVSTGSDTSLYDAYSFIPGGLISTSTHTAERTSIQGAMYEYGNDAGSYIQSYDELYRNAPQILKDQFEDRQNESKNARLAGLGNAMIGVGTSLQNIDPVPTPLQPANTRLGKSYVEMGTSLKAVAVAKSDQAVLDAILAYNASVEAFTKNYVALATLFSAYGVSFKSDEAGSVFMFTNNPSF